MAQDHVLELAQLGARRQPELVAQQRARLPVGGERVGLAARAVEREHQLARAAAPGAAPAAIKPLELDDHLGGAAERELGVDPLHLGQQAQLLQTS